MLVPQVNFPVVDISPFLSQFPNQKDKQAVARTLDEACTEFGFFYLTGYQSIISEGEFKEAQELAKQFFLESSDDEKSEISIEKGDHARGYQRLGQNITLYAQDWHEGIDFYREVTLDDTLSKQGSRILTGKNQWPIKPAKFKPFFENYIDKMIKIGRATMRCMALAIGKNELFFDEKINDSFWVMRVIGYPPLIAKDGVGVSCGEHTDYGCLTLLSQDETKDALQVLNKKGEWINANAIKDCLVVNIGDMVNVWTNDLYKSTLHRVIHKSNSFRVSIPFFFEPNFDTVIEPLDVCLKKTGDKKHDAVVYGEHLVGKVSKNFDL